MISNNNNLCLNRLGRELKGNVAVKLHSGEEGNQNFLKPEFWKPMIEYVKGTVTECNTAYEGSRNTTEKHKKTIEKKLALYKMIGANHALNSPNKK